MLGTSQGVLQLVHVSAEAAALCLQPVPVEGQLGRAGLLLLQTLRDARKLSLQLATGLLQLDAVLLGRLGRLLLLGGRGSQRQRYR